MKVNNFPFGELLKRSWQWTIDNKILWIIAFFAGGGGYIMNLSFNGSDLESVQNLFSGADAVRAKFEVLFSDINRVIFVAALILVFALLFFLLGLAMRAAIIVSNKQIQNNQKYKLWDLIKNGFNFLPRLVLLCVLWAIPNLIFGVGFIVSLLNINTRAGIIFTVVIAVLGLLFNIYLSLIRHNAYCFVVIENNSVWNSMKNSIELLNKNFWIVVIAGLIEIGLGVAIGFGLILALIAVAVPFVILGVLLMFAAGSAGVLVPLFLGAIVSLCLLVVLRGATSFFFNTFLTNIYWGIKR